MGMKLYVGGLAYQTTDKELEEAFAEYGPVVSAVVIKDRDSGKSKGFGFVEMTEVKDGQNAVKEMNGKDLQGRSITVNEAREREDRPKSNFDKGFQRN